MKRHVCARGGLSVIFAVEPCVDAIISLADADAIVPKQVPVIKRRSNGRFATSNRPEVIAARAAVAAAVASQCMLLVGNKMLSVLVYGGKGRTQRLLGASGRRQRQKEGMVEGDRDQQKIVRGLICFRI